MKGNIKKLAVFVMIATIALFIMVTMVSADDNRGKNHFQGEYAFNAEGACLFAAGGFLDDFQPKLGPAGVWQLGPNLWEGTYTFNKDGTGVMSALHRFVNLQGPNFPPPPPTPSIGLASISWGFTYTVDKGVITFTYMPGTFVATYILGPPAGSVIYAKITEPWTGRISPDGKNILVSFGVPSIMIPTMDQANTTPFPPNQYVELGCNIVWQGFRIDE